MALQPVDDHAAARREEAFPGSLQNPVPHAGVHAGDISHITRAWNPRVALLQVAAPLGFLGAALVMHDLNQWQTLDLSSSATAAQAVRKDDDRYGMQNVLQHWKRG